MPHKNDLGLISKAALILIDLQVDFCSGGAYPVPGGEEIVEPFNEYIELFSASGRPVFAIKDYHPRRTGHFKEFGGELPAHCVKGTQGSDFHPKLRFLDGVAILAKGDRLADDGESAFDGRDAVGVNLRGLLEKSEVETLYIGGLAIEDSIITTALHALHYGYKVILLEDALRGRDLSPGDSDRAMEEMKKCSIDVTTLEQLKDSL
jgi:nicotinamidase/pyrazinamidase